MTIDDGRRVDRSGDGMARVLKLHDDVRSFKVPHPRLSSAQFATLKAFKEAHEFDPFNFFWPKTGETFLVTWGSPWVEEGDWKPTRTDYVVNLEETE